MKTLAVLVATTFILAACGGGGDSASPDTSTNVASSTMAVDDTVDIVLEVGASTGQDVTHVVAVGSTVRITVTNPIEDDEFHLHGYDLSAGEVPAGETATIEFVADVSGSFELESHHSGELLMTLVVE